MTGFIIRRRGNLRIQRLFSTVIISCAWALLLFCTNTCTNAKTVQLTRSNFDAETEGKSIFIKFCTTSCSHCKEMKIAWEVLQEEWEDDDTIIIGNVNCDDDDDGAEVELCTEYNIVGTPTLLYGTGGGNGEFNTLNEYAGDMSFSKLNQWVKKVLVVPECSPYNVDVDIEINTGTNANTGTSTNPCTELDKTRMKEWMALSMEDLQQMIHNVQKEEEDIQIEFDNKMKELQALYDERNQNYVLKKATVKNELKLLYSILNRNDDDDRLKDSGEL